MRDGSRTDRWRARAEELRARVEAARPRHASVDVGFNLGERDTAIGGRLLAEALAYRLFALFLPVVLLLVSGIGLSAAASDRSTREIASEAGLHGLFATQVAETAASRARWIVFLLMIPATLYALRRLYRALSVVHALAWHTSFRGSTGAARGVAVLGGAVAINVVAVEALGWIRRQDQLGGVSALVLYLVIVGGMWLAVSLQLPRGDVRWLALVPGALLVGMGFLFVNIFNVYVTTRMIENHADTYGALGVAAALLFSLVLVGRVIVVGAELNAAIATRAPLQPPPPGRGVT